MMHSRTRKKPALAGEDDNSPLLKPPVDSTPLFKLSPELLDLVLSYIAPKTTPTNRRHLAKLLWLSRQFTPLVRRRLFAKVSLILGDRKRRDVRLLALLSTPAIGEHVRALRLRAPEVEPLRVNLQGDPGKALVSSTGLQQQVVVERVTNAISCTPDLLFLEVETRVGTREEGQDAGAGDVADDDELNRLADALSNLTHIEQFNHAVPHPQNRLQVLSEADRISPFVTGLTSWDNLTSIELWRVRFQLPRDTVPPEPGFRLRIATIHSSELGGAVDLRWILGDPSTGRCGRLQELILHDIDFTDTPESSLPLLAVFPTEGAPPSYQSSLKKLSLEIRHKISPAGGDSLPRILSGMSKLETLDLTGAGVDLALIESLFSPFTQGAPPAISSVKSFRLTYCPSLVVASFAQLLREHVASFKSLELFGLHLSTHHPRTWSWELIEATPVPTWDIDAADWRALEKFVLDVRRKSGRFVVMMRHRMEVDIEEDSEAGADEEEDGASSSAQEDWDALFVPSSDGEEFQGWGQPESEESDF